MSLALAPLSRLPLALLLAVVTTVALWALPTPARADNALLLWPGACTKLPTPEARDDCERRQRRTGDAWDQEQQARQQASRTLRMKAARDRAEDLCFTRRADGERVCAN